MPIEIIDATELAKRWRVPESWIRTKVKPSRTRSAEQIPHVKFGRYIRFEYGAPALEAWLARHRGGAQDNAPWDGGPVRIESPTGRWSFRMLTKSLSHSPQTPSRLPARHSAVEFWHEIAQDAGRIQKRLEQRASRSQSSFERNRLERLVRAAQIFVGLLHPGGGRRP
jgi:hypothetical protein